LFFIGFFILFHGPVDECLPFVFFIVLSSFVWVFQKLQAEGLKSSAAMSDEEREEKELDLSSAEVVTKYKTAAEIVNSVFLTLLMSLGYKILSGILLFIHWTQFSYGNWAVEVQVILYFYISGS